MRRTAGAWYVWMLLGCLAALCPPALPQAHAAAHKKKKHDAAAPAASGGGGRADTARPPAPKDAKLAPKKDVQMDQAIQQTKDLRKAETPSKGPGLDQELMDTGKTEALMDAKLDEEIKLASDLLEVETGCEETSQVRFRLADLRWEKSKRMFFKANDFNSSDAQRADYTRQMQNLQSQTLDLYKETIDTCPNYSDLAKVMFYLGRSLMELDRAKEGADLFRRIIQDFPNTEWVPQAWFMVGEYYFNSANDALAALKAYTKATETLLTPVYGFAVYKQGWCFINVAEWGQALQKFEDVVHISEDPKQPLDDRTRGALRKEAIKDYVRAYANLGDAKSALTRFRQVGNAKEAPVMLESLGNYYISQGAHANVVAVYHDLIKYYPRSTRLPVFQGRVVDAVSRLGSPKDTVREVKQLTDYFLALRARIKNNDITDDEQKTINKDVGEAEEIAENTIRRLATEYNKEAKKLRGVAQDREFQFALELFKHYLDVFPEPKPNADVNYVFFMRFYYAEVLYRLEHFQEAAENYDRVVEMNPKPKDQREKDIVLAAAENAVRAYDELVQDLDRKNPPQISGQEAKPIPEVKQSLIHACRRYIDYVGSEGDKIVEIRYRMARIYYTYNHFQEAAPAFDDIVKNHPETQVACYSANLALDIYNGQKNYKSLKEASRSYLDNKKLSCGDDDRKRFAKIEEQSSFYLIQTEFEAKKKYIAAGNSYMQFYKDYPASEFADKAVFNAAVNYDKGNRLDKANEVRRFLVEKLPNSPLVPETLYSIAASYERVVDFENASKYLELFAKRYPHDKRSKDAVYNSALYRATLHDFDGAREGRQNYIKLYPEDSDVHKVAFSICEADEQEARLMEQQAKEQHKRNEMDHAITKKWEEAHDCYFSYIKNSKYTNADPDSLCHAQFRRGEIMRLKTKYDKGYEEMKKTILKLWPTWKKFGVAKMPRCAEAVAELQFRDLQWSYDKYLKLGINELNPTKQKQFDASVKTKVTERDKLIADYKEVAALGVPQWGLAALYTIGEAYRDSIEKLTHAAIPDRVAGEKITGEQKQMLRQHLVEMAAPTTEQAVEAYKLCVTKANELGLYNKWSVRSLDQLQKLRPQEYPLVSELLVPVKVDMPLKVQENALVIADGDDLKPVYIKFKEAPPPGGAPPSEELAPAAPPAAAAPKKEPTPAPQSGGDNVPAPVEE